MLQIAYQPQNYSGSLLLLRASKRPLLGPFERDLGWGPLVSGGVGVSDFPGGHGQLIEESQHLKIAKVLTDSFDDWSSRSAPPSAC